LLPLPLPWVWLVILRLDAISTLVFFAIANEDKHTSHMAIG
jgi:hypothetical protein